MAHAIRSKSDRTFSGVYDRVDVLSVTPTKGIVGPPDPRIQEDELLWQDDADYKLCNKADDHRRYRKHQQVARGLFEKLAQSPFLSN
jgi:hypothetical protein